MRINLGVIVLRYPGPQVQSNAEAHARSAAVECERLSAITLGVICQVIVQQLVKISS
jgi:hypothetical protein